ncbi:MAG: DNA polymerase III subunit alpha, partial [Defluviitaleaceae bacterium]|nr:DNA polymerase III subunit alpha [Defluviitaleaceae bacterium]
RHASTHAAGVVISDAPLTRYLPLQTNDGVITTQFTMDTLEELGLLKMDFLGLRTLTVINDTVAEVQRRHGVKIDLDQINMSDPKIFEAIAGGKTEGMFQLESRGMTSFMKELKPTSIDDLTAGISLFRPGPMDFIPKYVRSKNAGMAVVYAHPLLEPILQETYGVIVYQEQVMQIVRVLAGYSLARADLIRRAMSKKTEDVMAREKQFFIHGIEGEVAGCVGNGISQKVAEQIWYEMADFAKYAFNKAHAVAYATVGYQTAWLKTYYPSEYMAALLTSVMSQNSKVAEYLNECKKMGIEVLPPDINQSFATFSVVDDNKIRYGLNAIKNLGRPTVAVLVKERKKDGEFKSLTDFIGRIADSDLNKRSIEALIKAGAFSSLGGKRSQYICIYEGLMSSIGNSRRQNMSGQISLLDMGQKSERAEIIADQLPDIPEFSMEKLLTDEKEIMGIYVSGHPILAYEKQMQPLVNLYSRELNFDEGDEAGDASNSILHSENESTLRDGQMVTVGGIISKKNIVYTRKNNTPMCFLTIEDMYGYLEIVVFSAIYTEVAKELNEGRVIVVDGKVSLREDKGNAVICDKIRFLQPDDTMQTQNLTLWLKIPAESGLAPQNLLEGLSRYGGTTPVVIYDESTKQRLRLKPEHWVNVDSPQLIITLQDILGEDAVIIK